MAATLKCDTIQNASSATANITLDTAGNATVGNTLAMGSSFLRNRIINGNMAIDQRNAGASTTFTAGSTGYTVDRWLMGYAVGGSAIVQRVAGPNTYDYALQVQPQTGNTQTNIEQRIEYVNCYGLSGNSVTISGKVYVDSTASGSAQIFYYYSATNGAASTYVSLGTLTLTAGQYVSFSKTFTCPTLYPATASDTSSAGLGIILEMDNSAGRTFKWTDIQCEVGSVATPFERRQYGQELMLCQRYYTKFGGQQLYEPLGVGIANSATVASIQLALPVSMRVAPSGMTTAAMANYIIGNGTANVTPSSIAFDTAGLTYIMLNVTSSSGPAVTTACRLYANNSLSALIAVSTEL